MMQIRESGSMRPSARTSRPLRCFWLSPALLGCLVLVLPLCATSQSPTPSGSSASLSSPAQSQGAAPAKPTASVRPKHIITNEDLEPKTHATPSTNDRVLMNDNSPLFNCEAPCEQVAREQLGYGPDQEPEWRLQIVPARRELAADADWRGLLGQSIQQLNTYCTFLAQASQQVSPSGDDWNSRVQRVKHERYFEQMDKVLRQNLDATFSRLQSRIQEVSVLSPVRAALMTAQANRITNQSCEELKAH